MFYEYFILEPFKNEMRTFLSANVEYLENLNGINDDEKYF